MEVRSERMAVGLRGKPTRILVLNWMSTARGGIDRGAYLYCFVDKLDWRIVTDRAAVL